MAQENCYHCGDECTTGTVKLEDKTFCCHGCKTVFEILEGNDLSYYYQLEKSPGTSPQRFEGKYDFLKNTEIANQLIEFDESGIQVTSFTIPAIHCSSCIWILENLHKLDPAIKNAQVDFPTKSVRLTYNRENSSLYDIVTLLGKLGYAPYISLDDTSGKRKKSIDRALIYKLGVAGFAFGNIMFLSFPEYFEVEDFWLERFAPVFRWLMFAFSLPVMFYSAQDYLTSAFKSLRSRMLNIDVPIALGLVVLFVRSTAEIVMDWGTGFFDSLAGLVFFLLLGKFFQQKTYAYLSFERDYKSYFPVAVTQLVKNDSAFAKAEQKQPSTTYNEIQTQVNNLKPSDRILIRNGELLPVDGILMRGAAQIDYSFVTGEADPVSKKSGDLLYAGGRQEAGIIEIEVVKSVEQSYLTQLWSNEVFSTRTAALYQNITDKVSKHFTISIVSIALLSLLFWWWYEPSLALNVFTAVLIIACPCAIALAAPFTLGNILRIFGRHRLYLKNSAVVEQLAEIDAIVFDKTGTLTTNAKSSVSYHGIKLNKAESSLFASNLRASNHPLSRALYKSCQETSTFQLDDFSEQIGLGIIGSKDSHKIKIGSFEHVTGSKKTHTTHNQTTVHIAINDEYKGYYSFHNQYRTGVSDTFKALESDHELHVLSGDNDGERKILEKMLPASTSLTFNQKPDDKLQFIKNLQARGKKVLMVGDGLNDAGALAQSDVGIAVSEDVNVFSPACDGIIDARRFSDLVKFITLSRKAKKVIKYAFIFSLFYNLIGLGFALSGNLLPVVAAILMPLSSISIVAFTTVYTYLLGKQLNNTNCQSGVGAQEHKKEEVFDLKRMDSKAA
jgi:Cu+-exporting ATPase